MHAEPVPALVAFLLGTIAVARATRLLTSDAYPPAEALRRWWWNQTVGKGGWRAGWAPLLTNQDAGAGCPFCAAPYVAAVSLTWAILADIPAGAQNGFWALSWWILTLWATISYVAAMVVVRDEPPED